MPKLVDPPIPDESIIDDAADNLQAIALRKLGAAIADDDGKLRIGMRFDNNRVEYSIVNRPDPTMSGVTDAILMTALICAGRRFDFRKRKKLEPSKRLTATRSNGDRVTYKDLVTINLAKEEIFSTRSHHETLQALSIVVQNLAASAAKDAPPAPPAN